MQRKARVQKIDSILHKLHFGQKSDVHPLQEIFQLLYTCICRGTLKLGVEGVHSRFCIYFYYNLPAGLLQLFSQLIISTVLHVVVKIKPEKIENSFQA